MGVKLLLFLFLIFALNLRAQDYSWKISGNVAPVHVFFDGSPVFVTGDHGDFRLKGLRFFKDQFKESRGLSVSKLWNNHQIQLSYNWYANSYLKEFPEKDEFPLTDIRAYIDVSINYLHRLAFLDFKRIKVFVGSGVSYRYGREERLYGYLPLGTISVESVRFPYGITDLGINLINRIDYRVLKRLDVFFETNLYTTVLYGHKASKVYFKEKLNSDFRPARCDLSFGFGLSYNFNFKKANQLSGAEILPPFKNRN